MASPPAAGHLPAYAAKIVVTGPPGCGRTTLISTVTDATVLSTLTVPDPDAAVDFGRIAMDGDLVLYLFGTPGRDPFADSWATLTDGMLGWLLLVDGSRPESPAEGVETLARRGEGTDAPMVVVLTRADRPAAFDEQRVRETLGCAGDVPVVRCDTRDRESVKAVLVTLLQTVGKGLDVVPAVQ